MKARINVSIDVTKIDKDRLVKGAKGTYLNLTTLVDTANESQYGDPGFITQSVTKEEREAGLQTPILGNSKVVYIEGEDTGRTQPSRNVEKVQAILDDDIPF